MYRLEGFNKDDIAVEGLGQCRAVARRRRWPVSMDQVVCDPRLESQGGTVMGLPPTLGQRPLAAGRLACSTRSIRIASRATIDDSDPSSRRQDADPRRLTGAGLVARSADSTVLAVALVVAIETWVDRSSSCWLTWLLTP